MNPADAPAGFQYTAYISYSHRDARWAGWLHRVLEGYRVPSRLAGRQGEHGIIPRRLAPVFRDREDLSSASDLGSHITQALDTSRMLIVVCSPEAARSRWVNEEVRWFRTKHPDRPVHCLLVDGEVGGAGPSPFPPELTERGDAEPLAADPRPWADGKTLARQKIIAGMLGVRLDELRQRDLRRRRGLQAAMAAVAVAAIALVFTTVTSRIAERQERSKAEEMAGFIVDLGERLRSDQDLETLALMSQQAVTYLDSLDPDDLSRESAIKVGLALRQFGLAIGGQGDANRSIAALRRSRELFRDLFKRQPNDAEVLFELSQAEAYVGIHHFHRREYADARAPLEAYLELAQSMLALEPGNPDYMLEASYAATGLLALRVDGGQSMSPETLAEAEAAVRLAEDVYRQSGELTQYSTTMAWAADAHLYACRPVTALAYRTTTLPLEQDAVQATPTDRSLETQLAYRYSGLSNVLFVLGRLGESVMHRQKAIDLLEGLSRRDPSNQDLREHALLQRARLVMHRGFEDVEGAASTALEGMAPLEQELRAIHEPSERPSSTEAELSQLVLGQARLAHRVGWSAKALEHLERAREGLMPHIASTTPDRVFQDIAGQVRVTWWELQGEDPAVSWPELGRMTRTEHAAYRSCELAETSAHLAVLEGDIERALIEVRYLEENQFRPPGFASFCLANGLCEPAGIADTGNGG